MHDSSIAFGRVSRATFSTDPEFKTHITELVCRAYFNLHSQSLSSADSAWASAITAAAMQLCLEPQIRNLPPRELVQLFENVIRVSEEHLHEARRHAAMASNVFYLKETAMDATQSANAHNNAASTVLGLRVAHSGRLRQTTDA